MFHDVFIIQFLILYSFESLALEDDTSKDTGDPEKIPVTNDFDQQEPCTSKHVQTTKNQEKKDDVPVSSFYHELLEASYSNGGNFSYPF